MLIVTAGSGQSPKYRYCDTINYCKARAEEYGYEFVAYDLGQLGFGIKWFDARCASRFRRVKSAMKPELILKAMLRTKEKTVAWIDGDATLIRPIDEIDNDDSFDIALTVRPKANRKKTHYTNAGVVFIKNNSRGRAFIEQWVYAMPEVPDLNTETKPSNYSDQQTLEETLLLPSIDVVPWDAFGTVHEVCGARVKLLDCERYNNFWLIKTPHWGLPGKDVKILHFKGRRMHRITGYHEEFLA